MFSEIDQDGLKWYASMDADKYFLVLSDDIDSYLSCLFLRKKFGIEIGGFYDFKNLYKNSKVATKGKQPIYIDTDVCSGFAFGNHVTAFCNEDCINLNNNIGRGNYTSKFAGSTLITLLWFYDYDLKHKDHDKIRFYTMIDSWQKQFFKFRKQWDRWVEDLEIGYMTEIVGAKDEEWYETKRDLCGLTGKIVIQDDGTLDYTTINFEGIKKEFGITVRKLDLKFDKKIGTFEIYNSNISRGISDEIKQFYDNGKLFSNAMTYKTSLRYSVLVA